MKTINRNTNKTLDQHFLVDKNIVLKICDLYEDNLNELFEIGCGKGALTKYLITKTNKFLGLELDAYLANICRSQFNCEIIEYDIRNYTLTYENIITNLPYYLSSYFCIDILCKHLSRRYVIMLQLEFAQRITIPNNSLGICFNLFSNAKLEFKVSPGCFNPPPKVTSAIVSIEMTTFDLVLREKTYRKLKHYENFKNKKIPEFGCRFAEISLDSWKEYFNLKYL